MHDTEHVRQLGHAGADGIPAGMLGEPDDFGAIAAFVSSEHARFLTGTAIPVDGGRVRWAAVSATAASAKGATSSHR